MAEETDTLEDQFNRSLDDVVEMLDREIERLKISLETYRLGNHPEKRSIIRWHVHELDERQDTLEELKTLLAAEAGTPVH